MLIAGMVLLAAGLVLSVPGRATLLAVLLLPHFFPGPVPRPLQGLTPSPTVSTVLIPNTPGRLVVDIYRPAGAGPHPAMVLMLGVNPLPRGHEQVVTLADGIARSGIVTVVAESDALLQGEIRLEEIDNLVGLFEYLEHDPGIDPRRIGFSGFCVGAVLELLAAADPRIAARVAYVNAFSVYAHATDLLRAILTGQMPADSAGFAPWEPSALTRTVFLRHMIGQVTIERDRTMLTRELLEATPLTSPELQAMSPAGHQMRTLLTAQDPSQVDLLLANLPLEVRRSLERISPAAQAAQLRARIFVMHDVQDSYLPVSGARQLAMLLGAQRGAYYSEFRLFEHVVPGGVEDPVQVAGELVKLVRHIQAVLVAAHTVPAAG